MSMSRPFIHRDFLLFNETAKNLYHSEVASLPILDYHTHLNPKLIAENQSIPNITHLWLKEDHYKWRAMRTCGVPESLITGKESTDKEKFIAWADTLPKLIGNPLHHWAQMELKAFFGIEALLTPETAESIWEKTTSFFAQPNHGARDLIIGQNVRVICTTDDPIDSLEYHRKNNLESDALKLYPTWRPEKAMKIADTKLFRNYVQKLADATQQNVSDLQTLAQFCHALQIRHDFFAEQGCRISDYSVESFAENPGEDTANCIYQKAMQNHPVSPEEARAFYAYMLYVLAQMDAQKNWVRQVHIGPLRNPNKAMFEQLGADSGFDAINDFSMMAPLASHLSALREIQSLPRTVLYNLNPKENTPLAVLCGSFQDGTPLGRLQLGPAWWFLDHLDGMRAQLESLANLSCLTQFLGMLTDSRSILSMTRHDYFRRFLCSFLGEKAEQGLIPNDTRFLQETLRKMCFENARDYFNF